MGWIQAFSKKAQEFIDNIKPEEGEPIEKLVKPEVRGVIDALFGYSVRVSRLADGIIREKEKE